MQPVRGLWVILKESEVVLVFLLSGFIFDMVLHHLEVKGYDI
jgi:hypothetical protein